jgi:hypothetical protein
MLYIAVGEKDVEEDSSVDAACDSLPAKCHLICDDLLTYTWAVKLYLRDETAFEEEQSSSPYSTVFIDTHLLHHLHFLQGTKMVFAGIKKPQERMDLIAYLKSSCEA